MAAQRFVDLLNEQIGHEYDAHHQYVADVGLPELSNQGRRGRLVHPPSSVGNQPLAA